MPSRYTADNGGPIEQSIPGPTDAIGASNFPLRGGKHNPYEGGVRSTAWLSGGPLDAAVVAAGGVAPSKRSDQAYYYGLMHAVDWMPTLAAVAGYKPEPKTSGIKIDGINHWMSIVANGTSPCVYCTFTREIHEMRAALRAVLCCIVVASPHLVSLASSTSARVVRDCVLRKRVLMLDRTDMDIIITVMPCSA